MGVTIHDVAKEANVSVRTATRVFNDEPNVRPQTRLLVEQAATRLGWRPNAAARRLVRGKTENLGVIIPDSRNTVFCDIATAIETQAQTRGYDCLFLHSEGVSEREAKFLNLALDGSVDGLIVISNVLEANQTIYAQLLQHRIPVVFRTWSETLGEVDLVSVDLEKAGYLIARHLLNLGHKHIGIVLHESAKGRRNGRLDGFLRAHEERDLPAPEQYRAHCGCRLEEGYRTLRRLLENQPQITALFCHTDQLAMGSFRAARELKRRIPHDLAVVGCDNIEMSQFCEVPLTTISYSTDLLGKSLVDVLCQRIEDPEHPPQRIILPSELVIRESCGYELHR